MTDADVLRSTMNAIDLLVSSVREHASSDVVVLGPPRLVVDVGRAAATWTLEVGRPEGRRLDLVMVCEVDEGTVTDARLYVGVAMPSGTPAHSA